jgi:hypothetical protein
LQNTGSLILEQDGQQSILYPMVSNHNNSALLKSRPKPAVAQFSAKALHDYSAYQSVDDLGQSNPLLINMSSRDKNLRDNEPKRLMPNFPKKQGKSFGLNLGQNVSFRDSFVTQIRKDHIKVQDSMVSL